MPELPEVEVTRLGIAPYLEGQSIANVVIRDPRLRWPIPDALLSTLPHRTIHSVTRRAKFLLLDCGGIGTLLIHLGMSGSLRILQGSEATFIDLPQKHDHFDLVLQDQTILRLRDPRRFGAVLWHVGDISRHPLLMNLGPEPLTEKFNAIHLFRQTRQRHASIKQILMNNQVVVGVGNIYANEALFLAGINPKIAAGRISLRRYEGLVEAIKKILSQAIIAGGSSLRDFVNSDGAKGYFQNHYWVYARSNEDCKKCGHTIKRITQGQRSTFYCAQCQR